MALLRLLLCISFLNSVRGLQLLACCATASCKPISRASVVARSAQLCMCVEPVVVAEEAVTPLAVPEVAPEPKKGKTALADLEAGMEVVGKIRTVMAFGAFVDIGAETDALLHVSEICSEFVNDATEKLKAGETVTARIKAINLEKQQIALSCKEASAPRERRTRQKVDLSEYEGVSDKNFIAGTVSSITDFGAFVTLKEGVDGLVHISQVQLGGVGKVSDVLSVGQEVQVRITSFDQAKRRIGLSMIPWKEMTVEEQARGGRGRAGGGGGGFGGDMGFGEADKPFQMTAEEVETLSVGDDFSSPFEAAFTRAITVQNIKASKNKYARQVL